MSEKRLTITLSETEIKALLHLAEREYRHPRAQAALIIRHELEKAGLLAAQASDSAQPAAQVRGVQNDVN